MPDAKGPVFNPIDDLKHLLLFFVALWIFWFSTGGPTRFEAERKPFLRSPTRVGLDEQNVYRDANIGEQYGTIPTIQVRAGGRATIKDTPYKLFAKPIIYLTKGPSDLSGRSYVKIDFPVFNRDPLKITGLLVKDIFGKGAIIHGASALPYQGRINKETDVVVRGGSTIFLIEGQSPIGVSFRVNRCSGYLAQFQTFYPPIEIKVSDTFSLTYNSCVELHKDDPDFYKNDWRIYLKTKDKVWAETGGLVKVLDNSNNTLGSTFY